MTTKELLTELNLSEREATLYLALLESGQGTPTTLAQKTGLKRPTVYLDLESLRRKKLVGFSFRGKRTIYTPESPNQLLAKVEEERTTLLGVLPTLRALYSKGERRPHVRLYTELHEMRHFYLHTIAEAKECKFISHFDSFAQTFPGLPEEYDRRIKSGKIQIAQELFTARSKDIAHAKKYSTNNHLIRIMPKGMNFDLDISIWNEGVALFSALDSYLLVIEGQSVVQSFSAMFQMLWSLAKSPDAVKGK